MTAKQSKKREGGKRRLKQLEDISQESVGELKKGLTSTDIIDS